MRRSLILAAFKILAVPLMIAADTGAAIAEDGTWAGTMEASNVGNCGFEQAPISIVVKGTRFEVFAESQGHELKYSGSIEGHDQIEFWSRDWFQIDYDSEEIQKSTIRFSGRFLNNVFSGDFSTMRQGFGTTISHCYGKVAAYRLGSRIAGVSGASSQSAAPSATEEIPPRIGVSEELETDLSVVEVSGSVSDDSSIFELSINGRPQPLSPDGTFQATHPVPVGRSELIIAATDEWGNRAETRVSVLRKLYFQTPRSETQVATTPNAPQIDYGRYRALVIGNNEYAHIKKLKTAESDALAVAEALRALYGFEVDVLLNATRYDVFKALQDMKEKLTEGDNFLLYYAGHGVLDEEAERGYWLPVDAESDLKANWISTPDITDSIKVLPARHVLLVVDSCYSGTLVRRVSPAAKHGGDRAAVIQRLHAKPSRTVITSGGLEPVLDGGGKGHSVFARALITVLQENTDVLEAAQMFDRLRRHVVTNAWQTPEYADIRGAGHEGGDFLFVPQQFLAQD